MEKNKIAIAVILLLLVGLLMSGWLKRVIVPAGLSAGSDQASRDVQPMAALVLPVPESASDRSYLGITGTGSFSTAQLDAPILIIEFFDSYCSHCRATAPRMNEVYREIERRADLADRVKIIGIGVGDKPAEVRSFREEFHVPFPLFDDKERKITKGVAIPGTPMFAAVRKGSGSAERFLLWIGEIKDAAQFLSEIVKGGHLT